MAHDAQSHFLGGLGFAVMRAQKGRQALGQADETDGQGTVLEHLAHLVVRFQGIGIQPDALPHEEGIVATFFGTLDFQPFCQLIEYQRDFFVESREKAFHIALMEDAQPGQIKSGEA